MQAARAAPQVREAIGKLMALCDDARPGPYSIPRSAQRDGTSPDPQAPENRRYVEGQQLYLWECEPWGSASIIINNETLASPAIVAW